MGNLVTDFILWMASLLKNEAVPGLVALMLFMALVILSVKWFKQTQRKQLALSFLIKQIASTNRTNFAQKLPSIDKAVSKESADEYQKAISQAWIQFRDTNVTTSANNEKQQIINNTIRPSIFFNIDDLNFGSENYRIAPAMFVSIGLLLTFLGLISALSAMTGLDSSVSSALEDLLTIASAKFIMSLAGLFCSIIFSILMNHGITKTNHQLHELNGLIESRMPFISLEAIAVQQLETTKDSRYHFRQIGIDMVAELVKPLEQVPEAVATAVNQALAPVMHQVGQMGTDGVSDMIKDLSWRLSGEVDRALTQATDRFAGAGDQISKYSENLDENAMRMRHEIESTVSKLADVVGDLQEGMAESIAQTNFALNKGTKQMLEAMNVTLENIRISTDEGAKSIATAAKLLKLAAQDINQGIENAATHGASTVADQFETMGAHISAATKVVSQSINDQLLESLRNMTNEIRTVTLLVEQTVHDLQQVVQSIQDEAMATGRNAIAMQKVMQSNLDQG